MASSSSSSATRLRHYDVFLSFRGVDTRQTIVSHLYVALRNNGVLTFKDDRKLEIGDTIADGLVKAIQTSWFAVVILSENYATSTWCLEELRLIMQLHSEEQIKVLPIFYGVKPSDVRYQEGSFATAFQRYEADPEMEEKVSKWRRALTQVANLSGKHSRNCVDEADMIAEVVGGISSRLPRMKSTDLINLVGMEAHMMKMTLLLNIGCEDEVHMIGIWGMGGIGKSTIAKCLYDRFSRQFPAHCFLENVSKGYDIKHLQKELLSHILYDEDVELWSMEAGSQEIKERLGHQKVFVVLDNVDKVEQLHGLAKDPSWFGPGSRIIITTRDKGLLNSCGVNNIYEVKCLDDKDALQVFKKLAFGGRPPSDGFEQLFIRASRLAHGLPSALVAFASHLSAIVAIDEWEDELALLETFPQKNVQEILRASYDGLDQYDKTVFLHVACFFNGGHLRYIRAFLKNCDARINHLAAKCLVNISIDGCISMHILLVQTGREIVRQESDWRPSKQRFLWDPTEIHYVLDSNTGTRRVEGLSLHLCEMADTLLLRNSVFGPMHNLTFLKFFQHLGGNVSNLQLISDDYVLSRNLKLLHWDAYPLTILPPIFRPHTIIELSLRYSKLNSLWDGTKLLPNLRILDVTGSRNLRELPELSTAVNLEELILESCTSLVQIPESINRLYLRKLNMMYCDGLEGVILVNDLQEASLSRWGLKRIILNLPHSGATLSSLTDLAIQGKIFIKLSGLSGTGDHLSFSSVQKTAHQSVTHLLNSGFFGLKSLDIKRFSYRLDPVNFSCLSFADFPCLTELKLINLNIEDIPEDICQLQLLETLDLGGNDFVYLPTSMGQLAMLKYLSLSNCRRLKALPQLSQVERLVLSGCVKLGSLMGILGAGRYNLLDFCVEKCKSLGSLMGILSVEKSAPGRNELLELSLENCKSLVSLSEELSHFTKLTYLDLSSLEFRRIPTSIRELSFMRTLYLNNCNKIFSLTDLPESLKYLYAHGCESLEHVNFSSNHSFNHLDFSHCISLECISDLVRDFMNEEYSQEVRLSSL
ncbi:Disease resistance protein (TIR-NBS-LRR class) [Arabidopsis thaliana]|uniref:Disease resistance protein (TIR-NBS-LRR class) n=1 Tax=Arabidopsis thaliana TaxID=3702 RepID=Q0WQ93_ARATH|nr:Disease resistance protein (TIR-NBS-LRR class) [Arabidopsis thaliana]AEE35380.1 Disease resistance protein (TIR-NBS-LRR class) [Arabidopsis thaliana]BAF00706.1 hypothetical protein [Arabidopsis thaliana]|eukprot:NP_177427.2 Disease resistance protein (TIR-NBS-LRR class) [Arabidopsis thaliana]